MARLSRWRCDGCDRILDLVWQGYDRLASQLSEIDLSQSDRDLERQLNLFLCRRIGGVMTGYEPFTVEHGVPEEERASPPPAQSPEYDIAFVLNDNERVMYPLEGKVLKSDGQTFEYISTVEERFLSCKYSPFSSEAAMIGYLLSGNPSIFFGNIELKKGWRLSPHTAFLQRAHSTSDHIREVPLDEHYAINFRCHHMILPMAP